MALHRRNLWRGGFTGFPVVPGVSRPYPTGASSSGAGTSRRRRDDPPMISARNREQIGVPTRSTVAIRKTSCPLIDKVTTVMSQGQYWREAAVRAEQDYVDGLYTRLDVLRGQTAQTLTEAFGRGGDGGYAAQADREAQAQENATRLARLDSVENGLCFGRIDLDSADPAAETRYIGRIGLRDEEHEPLLIDWRAPAARPFYAAAPSSPCSVLRRRHLHVRERTV